MEIKLPKIMPTIDGKAIIGNYHNLKAGKVSIEKLGSKIIRHYQESQKRGDIMEMISVGEMVDGTARLKAEKIYKQALKVGDNTLANDTYTILKMLGDKK